MQARLCSPQVLSLSQIGAGVQACVLDAPSYSGIIEAKNKAAAESGSSKATQCPCLAGDRNRRDVPVQAIKH